MKNTNTHKIEIHKFKHKNYANNKPNYHVWCPTLDINTIVCQTELDIIIEFSKLNILNLEIKTIA